jgi:hypothetical protein
MKDSFCQRIIKGQRMVVWRMKTKRRVMEERMRAMEKSTKMVKNTKMVKRNMKKEKEKEKEKEKKEKEKEKKEKILLMENSMKKMSRTTRNRKKSNYAIKVRSDV